jgi:glucuronokinase
MQLTKRIHARTGLLGNPSDGYFGKTISCLVSNYYAEVTLEEHPTLCLQAHPYYDPNDFRDIDELASVFRTLGYYGGLRLLQAACKRFHQMCQARGVALSGPNFKLSYETCIPRQVGLAGSSAIVIATLRALTTWYGVEGTFSQEEFPTMALETETKELGITAGLQDRVIQTYGGVMYMDFARHLLETRGYGQYERLATALLPPLFVAYVADPGGESGKIHSDVRRRWEAGDPEVRQAMLTFASFAVDGRKALEAGDFTTVSALMNAAFALRRRIFGDDVLGPENLRMVELARRHGLSATTSGSGGAIIGVIEDPDRGARFEQALLAEGFRYLPLEFGPEYVWPTHA